MQTANPFNKLITLIAFFAITFCSLESKAQLHCGSVEFVTNSTENAVFSFDDFRDYYSGINLYSIATLRVSITDLVIPDPLCSWALSLEVDNNPGSGALPANWEELASYSGVVTTPPTIDELEIRIRNSCATSPIDNSYQTINNHADILDIIQSALPITAAGSCTNNVNGSGSFLSNPGEFIFHIDLRFRPGFQFDPGIYTLNLRFHLEENP